ncbi:MAG: exodeoxyribonuclease VII small subunit [Lachnospiraceae bacterium]|nr:exodeoxyribonuclease VII small subunit [Lachnospiraceae bacterium]
MSRNETAPAGMTIEESFEKLDEILAKMELDETGLEESFRLYEEGLKLVKHAGESIDKVEKQIRILSEEE